MRFLARLALTAGIILTLGTFAGHAQAISDAQLQTNLRPRAPRATFTRVPDRVFHARLSEPFRKQYTPDRLKATFKEFNEKNVDIDIVTAMAPTYDQPPYIDSEGKLILRGFFPTEPSRVSFEMDFVSGEGEWKLIRINVKVSPAH